MTRFASRCSALFIGTLIVSATANAQEKKPPKITYEQHVKPILRAKCFTCHNSDKKRADLDLSSYGTLMEGGASGKVIKPGESSQSYLYKLVTHAEEPFMPPRSPKLPNEMLETIRKWIDGGVLENDKSIAILPKRNNIDLTLKTIPTARPKEPAMPVDLLLEPTVVPERATAVSALATSPWAPIVAVAGEKQILLYNTNTLELMGVLPFPEGKPEVLKFSRNGSLLLAGGGRGGASGKVIVWNVKTGKRALEVGDELDTVLAADISSDHRLIALGGPQRAVRIYSTKDGQLIHELKKHTEWIYSVEFSPDGVLLATADRNGGMFVWEAFTGREYLNLKGHTKAITEVSWRADSNVLASCSEDGSIKLWEMENGRQVRSWGAHGGGASGVQFARDGRLVSIGRDRVTKLWDQNGKNLKSYSAFADIGLRATICDETDRVIGGDWNGEIRVWNAKDGKQLGNLKANPPSLATRVQTIDQELAKLKAARDQQANTATAIQAAHQKAIADLTAAQKAVTDSQNAVKAVQAQIATLQTTVTQGQATLKVAQSELNARTIQVNAQTAAVATIKAAADKAKGDKSLSTALAESQAFLTQLTTKLTASQKAVTNQTKIVADAQQKLTAATQALPKAQATAAEAPKLVVARQATVKATQAKVAPAQAALKQAEDALKAGELRAKKWKDALAKYNARASKK